MPHTPLYRALARALNTARSENLRAAGEPPPVSRRAFLKGTAAFGAVALSGCATDAPTGGAPRVAVVGAGMAGLSAAWHLKRAGIEARVYEARRRVGGRVPTLSNALNQGL